MAIKLIWQHDKTSKDITDFVSTIQWSGAHNQAAREVSFSVLNNPYDKNFKLSSKIKNADKIWLKSDKKTLFYGTVVNIQRKGEIGTVDFLARDMLYNLLESTTSGRWKKHTAEYITRCVCNDFKINVGKLSNTKYQIKKFIVKDKSAYDVIKRAYKKAGNEKTLKKYFIHMDGEKLCVTERGQIAQHTDKDGKTTALQLTDTECIYESSFEEDASSVVDMVRVINNKRRLVNKVKDAKLIKKYGIIQHVLSVDKGKGTKQAKAEIHAPERSASISAIGRIACVSGYKILIKDTAAGLTGNYLIINDTHTWQDGVHMMSLDLYLTDVKKHPEVIQIDDLSYNEWKKRKVNCVIFKYYASGNDARGKKRAAGVTCAAPPSVPFGTKFTYKGKTYKVTDRHKRAKFKNHLYYIGIMVSEKEASEANKKKWKDETKVTLISPKRKKKEKKGKNGKPTDGGGSPSAKKLVNYAKSFVGKCRYVWTAANPPGGAADCSGFVSHCLIKMGVISGRMDTRALANIGRPVQKGKQQAGDVVIFQGTYRAGPSHVGIMVDANNYVHCSSKVKNVTITPFNTGWVAQHFHSLRRVL